MYIGIGLAIPQGDNVWWYKTPDVADRPKFGLHNGIQRETMTIPPEPKAVRMRADCEDMWSSGG